MNYRQVTKEELDKYLARNPGATYRVNGQEQQAAFGDEDQGALMKILTNLTKPIRAIPGSVAAAISGDENYNNPFLTAREEADLREDPTKWGTKQAAGLGAYLVPGGSQAASVGGRIAGAAAKGAGAGALGGFSTSEDENELESILKGAGLGGLLGGGIQAGGEAIGALKNVKAGKGEGEIGKARKYLAKQRGEALGLDPNKIAKSSRNSVSSSTQAEEVIDDFFSTMDELGLPTRTSNIASKSADDALSYYGSNFNKLLQGADESITFTADDTLRVLDEVQNAVGNNRNIMKNATVEELFNDLYNLGDTYTPSQLNAVREKARQMINWSRSSSKLPMTERGTKAVFDSIDDLFKAKIPTSDTILNKMKNIYTVRPYIQGKAQLGDVIKIGTASTNLAVPTAGVNEAIQSTVGKLAQGAPTGAGTGALAQGIGNVARPVAQAAQRVGPAIAGQMAGQMPQQTIPQQGGMQQQGMGQGGLGQDELQALKYYLADAVMQGQISSSDANAVVSLLGLEGTDGDMTKDQSKAVALQESLNKLRSAWEGTGGGGRLMETLGINVGGGVRSLDQAKEAVKEDLGRLQSQGAINADERKAFENMMPNAWDSEAVVQQKLQSIQDRINAYL
jgi:hypothetical protein